MSGEGKKSQRRTTQLLDCKLCGSEISPYSLFCRNCGHPQGRPLVIALLIVFLVVLLALYVGFMLFCACNPERFEVHQRGSKPPCPTVGAGRAAHLRWSRLSEHVAPSVLAGRPRGEVRA